MLLVDVIGQDKVTCSLVFRETTLIKYILKNVNTYFFHIHKESRLGQRHGL